MHSTRLKDKPNNVETFKLKRIHKPQLSRNDSKNIPRNFGKAIIIFVEKNPDIVHDLLNQHGVDYNEYKKKLQMKKK